MDRQLRDRWRGLAGWLETEPADFDAAELEVFRALGAEWVSNDDRLGALDLASERFGNERVRGVIRKLCDPPIRFSRRQTLMQGDPRCDHTYDLVEP